MAILFPYFCPILWQEYGNTLAILIFEPPQPSLPHRLAILWPYTAAKAVWQTSGIIVPYSCHTLVTYFGNNMAILWPY